jgi:(p)ppGpp synthase/HD superfamily hydrolase
MTELQLAERIARSAHANQFEESTGESYIHHVERVVAMVDSDEAKAVAWLHDVLEDSDYTSDDLRAAGISAPVITAVLYLTREEAVSYASYIEDLLLCGDALALTVKAADLRDHLRPNCPPTLRPRYEAAVAMFEAASRK